MSDFNNENEGMDYHDYLMTHFVPNVHFELLPMSSLVSNQNYQRNISEQHIKKVANEFNIYQINPVKVSRRDGINYVFDGQHTIEIIALAAGTRDIPVWCMIYDDLIYEAEADIFANQMKYKKSLRPVEIFMANIEAGNEEQLLIKELIESYDLEIVNQKSPRSIFAVSALEYIYENYGLSILDRTIMLVVGAWEGTNGSLGGTILKGVALLCDAYQDKISDEAFMERLGRTPIKDLVRSAKERGGGALGYAEAILGEYNKRTKSKLQRSVLYTKKTKKRNNMYAINEMLDDLENDALDEYDQEELEEDNE